MEKTIYLVELMTIEGDLVGLEKFTIKEMALAFIDDFTDSSVYCNLFEAKQLDY